MTTRTDIHRPSVIQPEDYQFIAILHKKIEDMGDVYLLQEQRARFREHLEKTGGKFADHQEGGKCHVCGNSLIYSLVFYHADTNTYIKVGNDCADKLDMGDPALFAKVTKAAGDWRKAKAGKAKAEGLLAERDKLAAWEIYNSGSPVNMLYEEATIHNMVSKLVRFGSLSQGQWDFMDTLFEKIDNREKVKAEREAEKAAALPCPTGRHTIEATVLKTAVNDTAWGHSFKMTIKTTDGYLVHCSIPSDLQLFEAEVNGEQVQTVLKRGDVIRISVTLTPSQGDPKFGFGNRPTKAEIVSLNTEVDR